MQTGSTDAIWSFDVFVHINKPQFEAYTKEFARVLKPGGVGVVHHGAVGGASGGWRSDVTTADVERFLTSAGLHDQGTTLVVVGCATRNSKPAFTATSSPSSRRRER